MDQFVVKAQAFAQEHCFVLAIVLSSLLSFSGGYFAFFLYVLCAAAGGSLLHVFASWCSEQVYAEDYSARRHRSVLKVDSAKAGELLHEQLCNLKAFIVREFVVSWYRSFANDSDAYKDIRVLLDQAFEEFTYAFMRLDIPMLLSQTSGLFQVHLLAYSDAKRSFVSAKHSDDLNYHIQEFGSESQLHAAIKQLPHSEYEHNKGIAVTLLKAFLTHEEQQSQILMELLAEVCTVHVLCPLIDMISRKEFIYEFVHTCFSDSSSEECKENNAMLADKGCADGEGNGCSSVTAAKQSVFEADVHSMTISNITRRSFYLEGASDTPASVLPSMDDYVVIAPTSSSCEDDDPSTNQEYVSEELAKYFKIATDCSSLTPSACRSADSIPQVSSPASAMALTFTSKALFSNDPADSGASSHSQTADATFVSARIVNAEAIQDHVFYTVQYAARKTKVEHHPAALENRTVKRRYREFVDLHEALRENIVFKDKMKGIRRPKRFAAVPFSTPDEQELTARKEALSNYLKALLSDKALNSSEEMQVFLAYSGGGQVMAFTRRITDVGIPRLDKMLVKSVSGLWNMMTGFTSEGKSRGERTEEATKSVPTEGTRSVIVAEPEDVTEESEFLCALQAHLKETASQSHQSEVSLVNSKADSGEGDTSSQSLCSEHLTQSCNADERVCPLSSALLELGLQCLHYSSGQCWVLNERVVAVLKKTCTGWLQMLLDEELQYLTSDARLAFFVRLLNARLAATVTEADSKRSRHTDSYVHGDANDMGSADHLNSQSLHKDRCRPPFDKALNALNDFFPYLLRAAVGEGTFEKCLRELLGTFEDERLNKHIIYTVMDTVVEELLNCKRCGKSEAAEQRHSHMKPGAPDETRRFPNMPNLVQSERTKPAI